MVAMIMMMIMMVMISPDPHSRRPGIGVWGLGGERQDHHHNHHQDHHYQHHQHHHQHHQHHHSHNYYHFGHTEQMIKTGRRQCNAHEELMMI